MQNISRYCATGDSCSTCLSSQFCRNQEYPLSAQMTETKAMNGMINAVNNEKAKETKKTSETDSFEDFENEAMENAEEGLEMEEMSISESGMPFDTCQATRSLSLFKSDVLEEQSVIITSEEQKRRILRDKYLNAVGRRPKNVPYIKIYPEEGEGTEDEEEGEQRKILFFGERRPYAINQKRIEKWQEAIKKIKPVKSNPARVLHDIRLPALNEGLLSVRFAKSGYSLATSFRSGGVEVRSTSTGETLAELVTVESKDRLPVRVVRYHPIDGTKLYVGGAAGIVQVFNLESSTNIGNSESLNQICNLDLNLDGTNLVTSGRNSKITILDASTFEVKSTRERPVIDENTQSTIDDDYHKLRVYGLKCHPDDPNVFVTGGWDSTVKIWDFRVPRAVLSIRGPWINGDGLDIFGNEILTASWRPENSVQIWDYSSGKLIKQIPVIPKTSVFEGEFLYTAKFLKDVYINNSGRSSYIAVAGNGFKEVCVLDVESEKVSAFFPSHKGISCLDTIGNMVAYGGKESLLRIGELILYGKDRYKVNR